ncbi:MAG: YbjN domain-containing protein [Leptolyngbyaceae cyanobacterium CSU_1_4]|nr:YbjN domain-containing protein [Leptolyngbyaceae cyanobacterium CSU_1_4]
MKDKFNTQANLTFHSDRSELLATSLTLVALEEREDKSLVCELEVSVDYASYQKVRQDALFNLLADQILVASDGLLEERDVIMGLRLKPHLVKDLNDLTSAEAIAHHLTQLTPPHFLLSTESWLATEFMQVEPLPPGIDASSQLRMGYQTLWAKPERLQPPNPFPIPMKAVVLDVLQSDELEYEEVNDNVLRLKFQGQNGTWVCVIGVDEENHHCVVYSTFPTPIPLNWRSACATLLAKQNYELTLGNFEMDLEDGDLRFRTALSVGAIALLLAYFKSF